MNLKVKVGRPRNIHEKKNRKHSVLLSRKAEMILRDVRRKKKDFSLSKYLSERIVFDFCISPGKFVKFRIGQINRQIQDLQDEQETLVKKFRECREKKQ